MKRPSLFRRAGSWAILAGLVAGGCSLPPVQPDLTRFYVLTAPAAETGPAAAPAAKAWTLGLRPVEAPPFLRDRAMLVRLGANEVRFADTARWAEPVDAGVARVLRATLEARVDVARVVPVTASAETPRDYDVAVRIERCEGARDARVARLVAVVEIFSVGDASTRVAREVVTTEIPGWDGENFAELAAKLSTAVDALAEKVITLLPAKS